MTGCEKANPAFEARIEELDRMIESQELELARLKYERCLSTLSAIDDFIKCGRTDYDHARDLILDVRSYVSEIVREAVLFEHG